MPLVAGTCRVIRLISGAFGSTERIIVGLNKTTPYLLCALGIALCFRGNVINIGGEGQIAIGGMAASAVALLGAAWPAWILLPLPAVPPGPVRRR